MQEEQYELTPIEVSVKPHLIMFLKFDKYIIIFDNVEQRNIYSKYMEFNSRVFSVTGRDWRDV